MKKNCFCWVISALCASCASEYCIEGSSTVSRLDGRTLYVKVPQASEWVCIDSSEVVHGSFRMEGRVDSTVIASLFVGDDYVMPLVIEKGNIQLNIDNAGMTVKGTPLNNRFNDFMMKKNALDDRAYEVERTESRMIMDGSTPEEVRREVERQRRQLGVDVDNLAKRFIQENYDNVLGPGVFLMFCNGLPYPMMTPVMEEIIGGAPETFRNHPQIKDFLHLARENMRKMEELKRTSVGS